MTKKLSDQRFDKIRAQMTRTVHAYMKRMGFTENEDGVAWSHFTSNALQAVVYPLESDSRINDINELLKNLKPKILCEGNSNRALPCMTPEEAIKLEEYCELEAGDPKRTTTMTSKQENKLPKKLMDALVYVAAYDAKQTLRGNERY